MSGKDNINHHYLRFGCCAHRKPPLTDTAENKISFIKLPNKRINRSYWDIRNSMENSLLFDQGKLPYTNKNINIRYSVCQGDHCLKREMNIHQSNYQAICNTFHAPKNRRRFIVKQLQFTINFIFFTYIYGPRLYLNYEYYENCKNH